MHRHEHADSETLDELSASQCVAVADTPIYGKHDEVESTGNLMYVLQFAEESLLFCHGIDVFLKFFAVDFAFLSTVSQESCISVAEITGMENGFSFRSDYPRHTAIIASCGHYLQVLILPYSSLCHPHISIFAAGPSVSEDVF